LFLLSSLSCRTISFVKRFCLLRGKGQIIDIIIILQCGAERKAFLTVAIFLSDFFHKKNTGASIETPVFRNNIFMLVPCPKRFRTAAMYRA
jgi:hypothetical protein